MPADSSLLRDLARELGVNTEFWGFDGTLKNVADHTLLDVLAALGHRIDSDEDVHRVRAERERTAWQRVLPPVVVMRSDADYVVHAHVPHGAGVRLTLQLADGSWRNLDQVEDFTPPFDLDGQLIGQASFRLPVGLPLGYHRLDAHLDSSTRGSHGAAPVADASCEVIVTPARITVQDEVLGEHRAMGVAAQLYSVRSTGSWGVGDLADMRDLAVTLGATHGADFLLVNPLHAGAPTPPLEPSPYLPVTRRFTSALYLRIEDTPEYAALPEHARQKIELLRRKVAGWNDRADVLERDAVLTQKLEALQELFYAPRSPARQALFDAYRAREGRGLEDYALWCALMSARTSLEDQLNSPLPVLGSEEAEHERERLAEQVDFHAFIQFLLDEQMGRAQAAARDAGMRLGVMHDLAVGVHALGSDAWSLGDAMAKGVGVGAPADQYNLQGQNWHQPPWHPERLAEAGYRPWRDMLRSLMRHCGALRIDHILGLFRLWWVPSGNVAADGAYVTYDHEAMIGILALEAQLSGTVVIGEDLGTFEPWVRVYLAERGVLGTSILWFEFDGDGAPLAPEQYRRACLASVNTHDLPPTAGYLDGEHVRLRHELGILTGSLEEEMAADEAGRETVLRAVRERGLLANGPVTASPEATHAAGAGGDSAGPSVEDAIIALHRYLAKAPSQLLGISLVDCVGETRIQNQPGTDKEYPNWRVPLADAAGHPVSVEDLATNTRTARLLGAVREELDRA